MQLKKIFIRLLFGFTVMVNGLFALDFEIYHVYNGDGSYSHTVDTFALTGTYNERINVISGTVYVSGGAVINGDLNMTGGTVTANGSSLTINGNILLPGSYLRKATLNIDYGLIHATGDCNIDIYNGSASLSMIGNGTLTIDGDLYITTNSDMNELTGGILEVKGNFIQSGDSFKTSGTHKVLLSGDTEQIINLYDFQGRSHFNVLEINNTSVEGVTFTSPITIHKTLITTTSKINNLHIKRSTFTLLNDIDINGTLSISEYSLIDFSDNTITITEDLNLSTNLNLNMSTLNIGRNFEFYGYLGGVLRVDNATVNIENNFTIGNYGTDNVDLNMVEENGYIFVGENFLIDTDRDSYTALTAGILEVKGNFSRASGANGSYNFRTSGTYKVLLSGNTQQFIDLNTFQGRSTFNVLEINNTSAEGVTFLTPISIGNTLITTSSKINNLHISRSTFTLINDITIDGTLSLSDYGFIDFSDKTVTITGDLHVSSSIDLNMSTLNVAGDFDFYGYNTSTLRVDNATVNVGNDFTIGNLGTDNVSLNMIEESGYVLVAGHFIVNIDKYNYGLTAGTLEVKGDFIQSGYRFQTSGTHSVLLSGDVEQLVNFGNTTSNFHNLNIINTSMEGVTFQTLTRVYSTLTATSCTTPLNLDNVTYGTLNLDGSCTPLSILVPDETLYFLNDSGVTGQRTYNNDGSYTGSLTLPDGTVLVTSGTYSIAGDVMTVNRTSPSVTSLVLTYLGEVNGVKTFTLSVDGGAESLSYSYDTQADRDNSDLDIDGFTDLEEYTAGTDATDASDNPLTVAIMNKTTYFLNSTGTIGDRNYVDDGTYTGNILLANGTELIVSGTYEIEGKVVTLTRSNGMVTVLTYISTDEGVSSFDTFFNEEDSVSLLFDTEAERDAAYEAMSNATNPAIIMYLLN